MKKINLHKLPSWMTSRVKVPRFLGGQATEYYLDGLLMTATLPMSKFLDIPTDREPRIPHFVREDLGVKGPRYTQYPEDPMLGGWETLGVLTPPVLTLMAALGVAVWNFNASTVREQKAPVVGHAASAKLGAQKAPYTEAHTPSGEKIIILSEASAKQLGLVDSPEVDPQ